MKFSISLILIVFTLASCKKNSRESFDLNIQKHGSSTIIDSIALSDIETSPSNSLPINAYYVFYIGKSLDTIRLTKKFISINLTEENDRRKIEGCTEINSGKLTVYIDTLTTFADQFPRIKSKSDTTTGPILVKSYGIFLYNNSDSPIHLGRDGLLHAIRQIKTLQGKWVTTEGRQISCGNGTSGVFLNGHEMLISKLIPRTGKFKLESRLRIESLNGRYVYSNTFIDQLDSIPNADFSNADLQSWMNKQTWE